MKRRPMLSGVKLGMKRLFLSDGSACPVTCVRLEQGVVLAKRAEGRYLVGFGQVKARKLNRPTLGQLKAALGEAEAYPCAVVLEYDTEEELEVGKAAASVVEELVGERFDVTGRSKGKGFAGVMKRWNFHGGPKTHGSKFKRRPGSIGQHTSPGKVFKGKKMAGHYGNETVTTLNLSVVESDGDVVYLRGAVPGPVGGRLFLRRTNRP